jgi:hypothetical protein
MRKPIAAVLAVAGLAVGMSAGTTGAKITPANCTNGGGHQPPGQQPVCHNTGGLDQNPALNPAGHPRRGSSRRRLTRQDASSGRGLLDFAGPVLAYLTIDLPVPGAAGARETPQRVSSSER